MQQAHEHLGAFAADEHNAAHEADHDHHHKPGQKPCRTQIARNLQDNEADDHDGHEARFDGHLHQQRSRCRLASGNAAAPSIVDHKRRARHVQRRRNGIHEKRAEHQRKRFLWTHLLVDRREREMIRPALRIVLSKLRQHGQNQGDDRPFLHGLHQFDKLVAT